MTLPTEHVNGDVNKVKKKIILLSFYCYHETK